MVSRTFSRYRARPADKFNGLSLEGRSY